MSIERSNYEAYLMDYLDGKLDALAVSELLGFLDKNPDIKEEFESMQMVSIEPDDAIAFDASFLKKPSYTDVKKNYEDLLIGKLEKDLSLAEYEELAKAFQLYPELKQDEALFQKTKLHPDKAIIFPNKSALKKREKGVVLSPVYLRVAALLLALVIGWWMLRPLTQQSIQVADVQPSGHPASPQKNTQPLIKHEQKDVEENNNPLTASSPDVHTTADQNSTRVTPQLEKEIKKNIQIAEIEPRGVSTNGAHTLEPLPMQKVNSHIAYEQPTKLKEEEEFPTLAQAIFRDLEKQKAKVWKEENKPVEEIPSPADAGWVLVRLFNKVTGADVSVTRKYDENGDRKTYEVASDNFAFSTSK